MSVFGIDHAWGRPSVAAMKSAGVKFVARYLSYDTAGKNLTAAEARKLTDAGIWVVVVWETTASRALSGRAGGQSDAREAASQAAACGMPDDRPIYFAVDWDAAVSQQDEIHAYLDGAASVLGRDRIGMYAGYGPTKRAFDAKKITYGWQTYAWSAGRWDTRAQLQQYSNGRVVGGVDCDYDRAMHDDYGQWMIGESPMALSDADKKWILANLPEATRKATWDTDKAPAPAGTDVKNNPYWAPVNISRETYTSLQQVKAAVAQLAGQSPDVDESAIVAGVLAGLTPEAIADAVVSAMAPDMAHRVVDELAARLGGV